MIVYDLRCDAGHRFEGWFRSSEDYGAQHERGLVRCPQCDSPQVAKAPMAPAVPTKGNRGDATREPLTMANSALAAKLAETVAALREAQAKALQSSEWVGDRFAEEVRAMHYGERAEKLVHGRASTSDAEGLLEEGIAVAPLLIPVCPPDEQN